MSFTGVFGLVLVAIMAIALIGPSKLPRGLEQLGLLLTNLRLSSAEQPPITLEDARRSWRSTGSIFYGVVQIMYGAEEHLLELRRRIFVVIGALAIGAILAGIFANRLLSILVRPAHGVQLVVLHPTDMIWVYFEVILGAAAIVTLPVIMYETLMFIRPALETPQEISAFRAIVVIGMPLVAVFFILGLTFAYIIMLPFALQYLASFGSDLATANWNVRAYFSFVLQVLLWIGFAFETPLVMALLARLGLASPQAMLKQWRIAIIVIALVAAIITPTTDPVNMALVMGPLLALYFLGVAMAKVVYRPRQQVAA
jgi:sec-independent protein translocase protein TatC